eukprot:scaffold914_cov218-Amphora_coffeaeformis.AAC.2
MGQFGRIFVCLDPISRRRDWLRQSNGSFRGLLGLEGRTRSQTTAILRASGLECTGRAIDCGLECTTKEVYHIWGEVRHISRMKVCHISRVLIHERDRNSSLEWDQVFGPVSCSSPLFVLTFECEGIDPTVSWFSQILSPNYHFAPLSSPDSLISSKDYERNARSAGGMRNDKTSNLRKIHDHVSAYFSGHVQLNNHISIVSIATQNHESKFHNSIKNMIYRLIKSVLFFSSYSRAG